MASPTENNTRKRVCKACDRCRLKKSKCDGSNPCGRCKADNAICVFGERKKSHDKVYPKGYVEILEQQQAQLVAGLCELYRRLNAGEDWPGVPLTEQQGGHPLIHDILERLDLLQPKGGSTQYEPFDEDLKSVEQRLRDDEAAQAGPLPKHRGSIGSKCEHACASSPSSHGTLPTPPKVRSEPSSSGATSTLGVPTPPAPMNQPLAQHGLPLNDRSIKARSTYWDTSPTDHQTAAQLMCSPITVEVPIIYDIMNSSLLTPFELGHYEAPMDPYLGQPLMDDQWVASLHPSALQNDFATQLA